MLKANETNFKDVVRRSLRYRQGSVVPDVRNCWWTYHPLESCPPSRLPAPHTLMYNDGHSEDTRRALDVSSETQMENAEQLEPLDLSIKNIPEIEKRRKEACELLRMLLDADDDTLNSVIAELAPILFEDGNEHDVEVPLNNQTGQCDKQTSSSSSSRAVNSSPLQATLTLNETLPQQAVQDSLENTAAELPSALPMDATKQNQTRSHPEPTKMLRPVLTGSKHVFPDPKSAGLFHPSKQNDLGHDISSNQQVTPSVTAASVYVPSSHSIMSQSLGLYEMPLAQQLTPSMNSAAAYAPSGHTSVNPSSGLYEIPSTQQFTTSVPSAAAYIPSNHNTVNPSGLYKIPSTQRLTPLTQQLTSSLTAPAAYGPSSHTSVNPNVGLYKIPSTQYNLNPSVTTAAPYAPTGRTSLNQTTDPYNTPFTQQLTPSATAAAAYMPSSHSTVAPNLGMHEIPLAQQVTHSINAAAAYATSGHNSVNPSLGLPQIPCTQQFTPSVHVPEGYMPSSYSTGHSRLGLHEIPFNQQVTPSVTTPAAYTRSNYGTVNQSVDLHKFPQSRQLTPSMNAAAAYESSSHTTVNSGSTQGNFVDPATIRRPPVKRKPAGNSTVLTAPSAVPLYDSNGQLVSTSYRGAGSQPSARALSSLSKSTSARGQWSQSQIRNMASQGGSKGQAISPEQALRSYPSMTSLAAPLSAQQAYSMSKMSRQLNSQRMSGAVPTYTYPVSRSQTTTSSLHGANALQYSGLQRSRQTISQQEVVQPTERKQRVGATKFNKEELESAYVPLHERWLRQQFASIIETPGRGRRGRKPGTPNRGRARQPASRNKRKPTEQKDLGTRSSHPNETQLPTNNNDRVNASTSYQPLVSEPSPTMYATKRSKSNEPHPGI